MTQLTRECPTCHTPLPGMAAFCYVCGTATPVGTHRLSGQTVVTTAKSGIDAASLMRKLQRALGPGYELADRIGAGGFAEVFKARDLRLKRDLAVKVLRPDLGLSPDLLQRFRREAETIATLRNPHIVPVYDIGEAEGLAFIIMPLIAGESLRAALDRDGPMPPAEVSRILREASSGLAAAHEAGVIHRDIKPENIMLEGRDKRALLMDFGIAKAIVGASGEEGDPGATLTTTGIIIGTPQYMSPEQAAGDKTIDARTDQYSLAVVGYRMLSGVLPFQGDSTRAVLYQQLVAEPPLITTQVPGVPPALAETIRRAMSKEPADRFADMVTFSAALDAEVTPSLTAAPAATAPMPKRRRQTMMAAGAGGVLLLLLLIWLIVRPGPPAKAMIPLVTIPAVTAQLPPPSPTPPAATSIAGRRGGATANHPPATPHDRPGIVTSTAAPPPAAAPATPACAAAVTASDWKTALTACTAEASRGSVAAERLLGTMYDKGTGIPADPVKAVSWYKKAAASDPEAQFLLSHLTELGRGTDQNSNEATALLRESAAGGYLKAQQTLAYRLENGNGIHKDETEAALWYRRGAEKGDPLSQEKLGEFLARGRGVDKDEKKAVDWFQKSASQGDAEAEYQLSQMYFKGHGVDRSDSLGLLWLKRAAAKHQQDAVKELTKRGG